VSDRTSLSQWLFRLHNDVNVRSSKPQFPWGKYIQRWGSGDRQLRKQAMNGYFRYNTPAKSTSSKNTVETTNGSVSTIWTSFSSTDSSMEVAKDLSSVKFCQPVRKEHSTSPPGISLPRRCLSMQQLYPRRNGVSESKGPFIPRNRVYRRQFSK